VCEGGWWGADEWGMRRAGLGLCDVCVGGLARPGHACSCHVVECGGMGVRVMDLDFDASDAVWS